MRIQKTVFAPQVQSVVNTTPSISAFLNRPALRVNPTSDQACVALSGDLNPAAGDETMGGAVCVFPSANVGTALLEISVSSQSELSTQPRFYYQRREQAVAPVPGDLLLPFNGGSILRPQVASDFAGRATARFLVDTTSSSGDPVYFLAGCCLKPATTGVAQLVEVLLEVRLNLNVTSSFDPEK